jgi:hypothetical protein
MFVDAIKAGYVSLPFKLPYCFFTDSPHIKVADAWLHAGQKSTVVLRCQICSDYPFHVSKGNNNMRKKLSY